MKKLIVAIFLILGIFAFTMTEASYARGRYGSHRVGGYNSHGKGSHYVGGYTRTGSALHFHNRHFR